VDKGWNGRERKRKRAREKRGNRDYGKMGKEPKADGLGWRQSAKHAETGFSRWD